MSSADDASEAAISVSFATVEVTYAGRTVALADLPEYRKFYGKLAAGTWEPDTFAALARHLDENTVAIDIGGWIGVTPFWSAQVAKAVIAVEPDPRCAAILRKLAHGHENVTILEGALSDRKSVSIHAVDGFGSSETSVLDIGDGEQATAHGLGMDDILDMAGASPCFVKIDIEGYEYLIGGELARLSHPNVVGIQIAVHPQLYEKSLGGPGIASRLRTALATLRLARLFATSFCGPTLPKYASLASYMLAGIVFRRVPKGADFLFERRPQKARPPT